ncbi:MAG: filamentous hemagglutinin N-terminal domain-containing protein [Selenomonadaceae bacterium]|nr:filamentous hemagglutinin N-terminal domain-containing protein [Selenomonadaceae bacterium]MDY2686256.1 filamentous hemagglutinin N-terminal domain-containing protein [Selenomonadaceae bacterium]
MMKKRKQMLAAAIALALSFGLLPQVQAMPQGGEVLSGGIDVIPGLSDGGVDSQDWSNGKWGISGDAAKDALKSLNSGTMIRSSYLTDDAKAVVLRWNSFDMAAGENLTLNTAEKHIPLVNIVSGGTATSLGGMIKQKGAEACYIVNPNGINVSGTLNAANLTLSTAEAADDAWKDPETALASAAAKGDVSFASGAEVTAYHHFAVQAATLDVAEGVTITLNPDGNNNYVDDGTGTYVPEKPSWDKSTLNLAATGDVTVAGTITVTPDTKIAGSGTLSGKHLNITGSIADAIKSVEVGSGADTPVKPGEQQPSENPDQPSVKPDQPSVKPDQPSVKPDQPSVKPDQPSVKPDQPSEKPDQPSEKPDQPSVKPDQPSVKPDQPSVKPGETPAETPEEKTEKLARAVADAQAPQIVSQVSQTASQKAFDLGPIPQGDAGADSMLEPAVPSVTNETPADVSFSE